MQILILIAIACLFSGCVTNPADGDVRTASSAGFYGSKAKGVLTDPKSAQVALVKMNDEPDVIQLDGKRGRFLPPGRHRVKIGVSVIGRASFVTFPFVAEAGKNYHFTGREVDDGFEITAYEGAPVEGAVVFRAHVPFGLNPGYSYIDPPSWSEN